MRAYLAITFLCLSAFFLIGLQLKIIGFFFFFLGSVLLFFCQKEFFKHILLLYLSVFILGITPISSDVNFDLLYFMISGMLLALLFPYLISKYIYKDQVISIPAIRFNKWSKRRFGYLIFVLVTTYLLLEVYFSTTQAYTNWPVYGDTTSLVKLFIDIFVMGLWDELLFVCTFFVVLRKFLSFTYANIAQAVIFASFLYLVGFSSWGFFMIFLFALTQGAVYQKTKDLTYLVAIHWVVDLVLFYQLLRFNI